MFTDIVGYTALMQQNEKKAIQVRDKHRRIFNSITEKHKGRVLQYYGDGTLSIFNSAIDAVKLTQILHPYRKNKNSRF
jgi:class 3 adenylate cyclase